MILIVICTRLRPILLGNLLESCTKMRGDLKAALQFLVIENGPDTPARAVVDRFADRLNLDYVHEPELGLVPARNRSLDYIAAHDYAWIGSFDDDQLVDPNWLVEMQAILAAHDDADVITGKIIATFPSESRSFMRYQRPITSTKSRISNRALVVNSLIHRRNFAPNDPTRSFDMRLNLIGGEDVLFIKHIQARGGKIRTAPKAIVQEIMVPERSTFRFGLHRSFTLGQQAAAIIMAFHGPVKGRLLRLYAAPKTLLRAIAFAFYGTFVLIVNEQLGLWMFRMSVQSFGGFCGQISVFFTRPFHEYARVQGN